MSWCALFKARAVDPSQPESEPETSIIQKRGKAKAVELEPEPPVAQRGRPKRGKGVW